MRLWSLLALTVLFLEGGGSGADGDETSSIIDQYVTEDGDLAVSDDRIVLEEAIRRLLTTRARDYSYAFEGLLVEIVEKLTHLSGTGFKAASVAPKAYPRKD